MQQSAPGSKLGSVNCLYTELHLAGSAATTTNFASKTDDLTFLRGVALTNSAGVATLDTIFLGRFNGRSPHINLEVYADYPCKKAMYLQVW